VENLLPFHYKEQLVDSIMVNSRCWSWESYCA